MGHANIRNLNDIFIKRIFAKGKTSIQECIAVSKQRNEYFKASEGEYTDDGMLSLGYEEVVLFHGRPWCENKHRPNIEAIPENDKQQKIIESFNQDGLSYIEDLDEFTKILWKFTQGTRAMYLNKTIPAVSRFEN
jgi:hypothetical protein